MHELWGMITATQSSNILLWVWVPITKSVRVTGILSAHGIYQENSPSCRVFSASCFTVLPDTWVKQSLCLSSIFYWWYCADRWWSFSQLWHIAIWCDVYFLFGDNNSGVSIRSLLCCGRTSYLEVVTQKDRLVSNNSTNTKISFLVGIMTLMDHRWKYSNSKIQWAPVLLFLNRIIIASIITQSCPHPNVWNLWI